MSIKLVAEFAHGIGTPSLLYAIEVMGNSFDELDAEQQQAYEDVYDELMQFVKEQTS